MSDTKTTTDKVEKSEAEWRKELTPMQYAVLREKATERPFSGEYEHEHRTGHLCLRRLRADPVRVRRQVRFRLRLAELHPPATESHVDEERDISHGMIRTEVLCSKCKGHLGHVFNDGPGPTGPALLHQLGGAEAASRNRRSQSASNAIASPARPRAGRAGFFSRVPFSGLRSHAPHREPSYANFSNACCLLLLASASPASSWRAS